MNAQPSLTDRHRAPRNVHRRAAGRNFTSLRRVVWGCLLALLITACTVFNGPTLLSQPSTATPGNGQDQEPVISQIHNGEITIDGDLTEWEAGEWLKAGFSESGSQAALSPDLDVKVSFAFDTEKFYLAVKALDNNFKEDYNQYVESISLTLVTEEGKERSNALYLFGFDRQRMGLFLKNGEILPTYPIQDIEFKFRLHSAGIDYEIALPFELIKPFNPFIYKKAALNLVYFDQGDNIAMLYPDQNLYSLDTLARAGLLFSFKTLDPQTAQEASYHVALKKNFLQDGETVELRYAVNALESQDEWNILASLLSEGAEIQADEGKLNLHPGFNAGSFLLTTGILPTGRYTLRVTFTDQEGMAVSASDEELFILNRKEIQAARQRLADFKAQPELQASLSNVEIRFDWLDEFYQRTNYEDISKLNNWWGELQFLISRLEKREPAIFDSGAFQRYGVRSTSDNTLQPYTVLLPESFDPGKPYPLIVFLHGDGMDDQSAIKNMEDLNLKDSVTALGYPLILPKGRGMHSGYENSAGQDVFDSIEHFLSLYPNIRRERIILIGHSMGGIGAYRLGLLKPDYFRALVILAGPLAPGFLEQMEKFRNQNLFLVYGARDKADWVSDSRAAVEKLTAVGANFEYIELPEAGHMLDGAPWSEVIEWIMKYIP
jgi:pimeloyl-ACP methyl ester carboxylesterase